MPSIPAGCSHACGDVYSESVRKMIVLKEYRGESEAMLPLIQAFWLAHNHDKQPEEEAREDLAAWTGKGHKLYFISRLEKAPDEGELAGFLHLGSRGAKIDWLEDLFVLPEYQGQGIGSQAVRLAEEIVRKYSSSLYIEAAAWNEGAVRLYRRLGYDCLNTITVRKDFPGYEYDVARTEQICGETFEIRKSK